jgi:hypothetical protein
MNKTHRISARPWTVLGAGLLALACAKLDDTAGTLVGGAGGASSAGEQGRPGAMDPTGGAPATTESGLAGTAERASEGNSGGGAPATTEDDPYLAYCATEARCIPGCLCSTSDGLCECSSEERALECAVDVQNWGPREQGATCEGRLRAWVECINGLPSCEQVREFFRAHPDGVTESTPCGQEFFAMNDVCDDFEPPTEYNLDSTSGPGTDPAASSTGGAPATTEDDPYLGYCDMEARCIPRCLCDTVDDFCECSSEERTLECTADIQDWYMRKQGATCEGRLSAWVQCISGLSSCAEVREFFQAHPDDVTESTPCGPEYFALNKVCDDFEPLTEYSFDGADAG